METLAAIGLVGNIVQFVDFSSNLISKTVQLYRSSDGTLAEITDTETATNHLVLLSSKLKSTANTAGDLALEDLCKSCNAVAVDFLGALDKLKVQGRQGKWRSMRKALQNVWSKEEIQEAEKRLASFREELNLHVALDLRERVAQIKAEQSDQLKHLDITTRNILDAIKDQQDLFQEAFCTQTIIRTFHEETIAKVAEEHGITRTEIVREIELHKQSTNLSEQERQLAKLPCANGATFTSRIWEHDPRCLPETRVDLLEQIMTWSENPNSACIFWLNGMAGTGKSTVARTVARKFDEKKRLGASFLFSRGEGDLGHAGMFFTTLAAQLVITIPDLKPSVSRAIAENYKIFEQSLGEQWSHLIFQPLSNLKVASLRSQMFILVIDALDECEGEKDIQLILQLLAEANTLKTIRLRVFITSRPEVPIRLGFYDIPKTAHQDFVLHNVSSLVIGHDISIFFDHELKIIRQRRGLPEQWPGQHNIDLLVQKADGLFIYAATICRFIQHPKFHPEERLSLALQGGVTSQSPTAQLDNMYTQVLRCSVIEDCEEQEKEELLTRYKQIVGSVVTLFDSLTADSLAKLLCMPLWMVDLTLDSLRSVLDVPDSQDRPIRLLHPSFRDYVLDRQRCVDPQLWIDEKTTHNHLFISSLRLMSNHLKRDICNLQLPSALVSGVDEGIVEKCLPRHVQYACRYWVYHLEHSNVELCDNGEVHIFLQNHFLHWLEALSLIGRICDGVSAVRVLQSKFKPRTSPHLVAMIYDANRFILHGRPIY